MVAAPLHRARVFGSPWKGVHGTGIDSARHYGRHWHASYGLGVVEQGAQRSASGQGDVEAFAGDLITSNPGEVHDGRPLGADSRRWRMVYLEPQVVLSMADAPADLALTRPVVHDARLGLALRKLMDRLECWDAGAMTSVDALACDEALTHTCGLLLQGHTTVAGPPEAMNSLATARMLTVRDRLGDDPLDVPSLDQLAMLAGLSKFQLLRQFQKVFGLTPFVWLLQQRAERARAMIRDGVPLAIAAAACGFADQSHMTRTFTRHFGFTPGAWQQAVIR